MKKILLVINANNPDRPSIDFACYIGRLTKSLVTGVFLEGIAAEDTPAVSLPPGETVKAGEEPAGIQAKKADMDKNILLFQNFCERQSVKSGFHHLTGNLSEEMLLESRYADLLILDSAMSFGKMNGSRPSDFVKRVLKDAECPVLIAPASFEGANEIVFTFDGSRSSMFAIRQFTSLFPELSDKKAVVLHISKDGTWKDGDKQKFLEWVKMHYSVFDFQIVSGDTEDRLFDYLFKRKNCFIVMGAYGRSALSRFFRHSRADLLINILTQPVFIAHA